MLGLEASSGDAIRMDIISSSILRNKQNMINCGNGLNGVGKNNGDHRSAAMLSAADGGVAGLMEKAERPSLSYKDLIIEAIESSPEKRLKLNEIYQVRCVERPRVALSYALFCVPS